MILGHVFVPFYLLISGQTICIMQNRCHGNQQVPKTITITIIILIDFLLFSIERFLPIVSESDILGVLLISWNRKQYTLVQVQDQNEFKWLWWGCWVGKKLPFEVGLTKIGLSSLLFLEIWEFFYHSLEQIRDKIFLCLKMSISF